MDKLRKTGRVTIPTDLDVVPAHKLPHSSLFYQTYINIINFFVQNVNRECITILLQKYRAVCVSMAVR